MVVIMPKSKDRFVEWPPMRIVQPWAYMAMVSYPIFILKPSTHRMCAQDQLFHAYGLKLFIDNQMS
jgi:hypothetical protein